jgi:hypothetical protein
VLSTFVESFSDISRPFDKINLWKWLWNTDVDPNTNDSGKPKYSQINLCQRHFVRHNYHTVWPGLKFNWIIFRSSVRCTQTTHWHSSAGRTSCLRLQRGKTQPETPHLRTVILPIVTFPTALKWLLIFTWMFIVLTFLYHIPHFPR